MEAEAALLEDEGWLVSALNESRTAFLAFIQKRLGNKDDAEDVLQDASLKAFQNIANLRDKTRFKSWFYKILTSAIADFGRKTARNRTVALETPDLLVAPKDEEKVLCRCGVYLLDEINPGYANVLRRVVLQGESVERTAQSLEITSSTLWVRLHRARAALRKKLESHCNFAPNSLICRCACGFTACCCSGA